MRRLILIEIGSGVDLRGIDVTKAAVRAVRDAIGRNYIAGLRHMLDKASESLAVTIRLGVPEQAGAVNEATVKAEIPHGTTSIVVTPGGLLVSTDAAKGEAVCVVNAAVEVWAVGPD